MRGIRNLAAVAHKRYQAETAAAKVRRIAEKKRRQEEEQRRQEAEQRRYDEEQESTPDASFGEHPCLPGERDGDGDGICNES